MNSMKIRVKTARLAFAVGMWLTCALQAQLRFETEDYTTPQDAWQKDKFSETKWNLWSTDKDALKKWSGGGVVLQSPRVMQDRDTPEAGAPPLHTRLTGIPKGVYDIEIKCTRVLAVSLDGETWQRYTGGPVASNVTIADGVFELWVDDRYAMEEPDSRGSAYYDTIVLYPCVHVEGGVANPGFEHAVEAMPAGWTWWSREDGGAAVSVTTEKHGGKLAVHLTHDGKRDWAFSCMERLQVEPGDEFAVRGWVKGTENQTVTLAAVGQYNGKLVTWDLGGGNTSGTHGWKEVKGYFTVPADVNQVYVRLTGSGKTDVYVDDVTLKRGKAVFPQKPKVQGWATARAEERIGRGVVALPTANGVYVSWRLLRDDPADIAFDVYRTTTEEETPVKVNPGPIRRTTDFVDTTVPESALPFYTVSPAAGTVPGAMAGTAQTVPRVEGTPYVGVSLQDAETTFQKVGIADLNGDGRYDYLIKQPSANIDPWSKYWYASPESYKIEAYLDDGTFLWRRDLGWAIERGIWYSPWLAFDLTGDGKAEVAAKIGEGDPRDDDGKVTSGPEWLSVWDGMTGREIARVPWPDRESFSSYNLASRNQIAVAYLDGKTPCLLALRGTYRRMKVDAYQLVKGKLEPLWSYDNEEYGGRFRGQGAHFTICADVDADGRDEVILGSAVLDDNGVPLWSTGKGHPDHAYLGDIDPTRPGWEIYYGMETRQRRGGMYLADAASGELLWELGESTRHVHAKGICADLDPTSPGLECYAADADGHKLTDNRWMFAADGTPLTCPTTYGFGQTAVYWDADLQKEIVRGKLFDHDGGVLDGQVEGSVRLLADVLGDWREEIITSVAGELRIYATTIPATDRRVCLMQDRVHRMDVAMNPMGYSQVPMLSYCLEARAPNLNLTFMAAPSEADRCQCRVVVSAPLSSGLKGTVRLAADPPVTVSPASFDVDLKPGRRVVHVALVDGADGQGGRSTVSARLDAGDITLHGSVPVRVASGMLKTGHIVQAEDFEAQQGGEVRIRDDKAGTMEKAISHWDDKGHTLSWTFRVPAGRYRLVLRYCTPSLVRRRLSTDNKPCAEQEFPATGGFGSNAFDWEHLSAKRDGTPLILPLTEGKHTVTLENVDGHGLNLDYLALVPVRED